MTSLGTLDLNFLTLRRLFPYRNATTDICANTILLQNSRGEPVWIDPADVFGDVSGTLVAKGNCDSDYLYWDQGSQLWLAGGKRIHIGCEAGVVQPDLSAVTVAIGYNAGYLRQASTSIAIGQYAGYSTQGLGAVAMGSYAGSVNQRADGVAIGTNAGVSTQGSGSIAIGASAGAVRQDISAVAIGFNAGMSIQGTGAVAMGGYAGMMDQSGSAVAMGLYAGNAEQGFGAVAVGAGAGYACQTSNAVAVGYYAGSGNQGANAVAVGVNAGASLQGDGAVAMGSLAGSVGQGARAVAIGSNAGGITQGEGAVAVGYLAGSNVQRDGAVAIGSNAGYNRQDLNAVAMGFGAGYSSQGAGSIAIGSNAGYSTQNAGAVAIGMAAGFSTQGANAVAIGSNAGFGSQGAGAVAMGAGAGYSTQNAGAIAIGSNAGYSTQGAGAVALGLNAGWSSQGVGAVAVGFGTGLSTQGAGAVAVGSNAGAVEQSANAVAIGFNAGLSSQGASAVAIGWMAGSNVQSIGAIAVGEGAGLTRQGANAVAVGLGAGLSTQNANAIAIGSNAGYSTQGASAIALGQAAGISSQGTNAIAIGSNAGAIVQDVGAVAMGAGAGYSTQGAGTVAIGSNAGQFNQRVGAVGMGFSAGWSTQGAGAVAIGSNAGYTSQGTHAVAIGAGAGITSQGIDAIAIGSNAGATAQGRGGIAIGAIPNTHTQADGAIAIGFNAFTTTQSANSIAIGNNVCGANTQGTNAIAVGYNATSAGQTANSIILNATGVGLNATQQTLYVDPVLNYTGGSDSTYLLQYLNGTKAVVYNNNVSINSAAGTINVSGDILPTGDIKYSLGSSALAFKHLYVSSIISDTSNVAVSGDIVPYVDNLYSLGLSTLRWKDVFVGPGSVYIGGATNATRAILSASGEALLINSGTTGNVGIATNSPAAKLHVQGTTLLNGTATAGGNIVPDTNGTRDLGTISIRWDNIYTNYIDVSAGFTFTGNLNPSADDQYSLGINTLRWKDLYIGTGAVYIGGSTSATRAELTSATNNLIINATNGGSVGIGTNNPSSKLHLYNASATDNVLRITTEYGGFSQPFDRSYSRILLSSRASGFYGGGIQITVPGGAANENQSNLEFTTSDNSGIQQVRMTILGTSNPGGGNVGIGTTNPGTKLDVAGSIRALGGIVYGEFDSQYNAQIIARGTGANQNKYTYMGYNTTDNWGYIGAVESGVVARNLILLPFGANVGIGTTDPITTLDVMGNATLRNNTSFTFNQFYSTSVTFRNTDAQYGTIRGVDTRSSGGQWRGDLAFDTQNDGTVSEKMRIRYDGNVGIGTTDPNDTLDVAGTARAQNMLIRSTATGIQNELKFSVGSTPIYAIYRPSNTNDLRFFNYATNSAQISLTSDGNVGIGTIDPGGYKLTVAGNLNIGGNASNIYQHIRLGGGNSYGYIYGRWPDAGDAINIGYNYYIDSAGTKIIPNTGGPTSRISCGYGSLSFYTGGINTEPTEKMTILSNGRVGIGTNNPGYTLDVNGTGYFRGNVGINTTPSIYQLDVNGTIRQSSIFTYVGDAGSILNGAEGIYDISAIFPTYIDGRGYMATIQATFSTLYLAVAVVMTGNNSFLDVKRISNYYGIETYANASKQLVIGNGTTLNGNFIVTFTAIS